MQQLQKEIMSIIENRKEDTITYFNPIGFWREHLEVPHSGVISALLNPHDEWYCIKAEYKTLFLKNFISLISEKLEIELSYDLDKIKIISESPTKGEIDEKKGRIDIEIIINEDTSIIIENKIDAELSPEQLAKYYYQHKAKNKHIVYLSLNGDAPTAESLVFGKKSLPEDDVICLGYSDIANWLEDCLKEIKIDEKYDPLRQGVKLYLDIVYNLIEDDRSLRSLYKKVYQEILTVVDSKNITSEDLDSLDRDEDGYIDDVIGILERREHLKDIYTQLSSNLPKDQILISYEGIQIEDQHFETISDLSEQLTEILTAQHYWVGFATRVYSSQNNFDVHYSLQLNDDEDMWNGLICNNKSDIEFNRSQYLEDKGISFNEDDEEECSEASEENIENFCAVTESLTNDFKSFDTCKKYLNYGYGAEVYENIMSFLKEKGIDFNLKYKENKIDLCLQDNDWWLCFNNYALGWGGGSIWVFTDNMDYKDKLMELGFEHKEDKNDPYGENYLDFIFIKEDEISENTSTELTKNIITKIQEVLAIKE